MTSLSCSANDSWLGKVFWLTCTEAFVYLICKDFGYRVAAFSNLFRTYSYTSSWANIFIGSV